MNNQRSKPRILTIDDTPANLQMLAAALARDRLAYLLGLEPGGLDARLTDVADVPLPPADIAVADPASLLRRRPDIRMAERRLAASNAVVGQVVEPRELIFEIIDPDSLHVEATAYDPLALDQVAAATVALGERSVLLSYVGAPRRLREQALPLIFENHATGAGLTLPLGQPLKVQVSMKSTVRGMPLPMAALTRNTANQVIVWIKTQPERFEARAVQTQPLDGVQVLVSTGLKSGERVVVQGASLISQIR